MEKSKIVALSLKYWAGSLLPKILMILFTQSTAVLHKYLNDELKIHCLLQFFPEVAQNSLRIPESSMFREIPEYSRYSRILPFSLPFFRVQRFSFGDPA